MKLVWISFPYATFGIVFSENSVVVEAAPIGAWMIGKHIDLVRKRVHNKGGEFVIIEQVNGEPELQEEGDKPRPDRYRG